VRRRSLVSSPLRWALRVALRRHGGVPPSPDPLSAASAARYFPSGCLHAVLQSGSLRESYAVTLPGFVTGRPIQARGVTGATTRALKGDVLSLLIVHRIAQDCAKGSRGLPVLQEWVTERRGGKEVARALKTLSLRRFSGALGAWPCVLPSSLGVRRAQCSGHCWRQGCWVTAMSHLRQAGLALL